MAGDSTALPGDRSSGMVWRARSRPGALGLGLAGELIVVGVALGLLNAIVFVKQILRGGFYEDDWAFQAAVQFGYGHSTRGTTGPIGHGPFDALAQMWPLTKDRPLADLYYGLTHWAFGLHTKPYMAVAAITWLALAVALYAFLRVAGMGRAPAMLIALLASVFPFADANRLWAEGAQPSFSVVAFLCGGALGLAAFRAEGDRRRGLHAGSFALYLASVLTYQLTIGLIVAMLPLYLRETGWHRRARWREALVRWGIDVVVIVPLVYWLSSYSPHPRAAPDWARIKLVFDHGLDVASSTVYPFGPTAARAPQVVIGLVLVAGTLIWWRLGRDHPRRLPLGRWLTVAAGSIVALAAGFAPLVATAGYDPLAPGEGNRINIAALPGAVVFAVAVFMVVALSAAALSRSNLPVATVVAVVVGLCAGNFLDQSVGERDRWISAYKEQQRALAGVAAYLNSGALGPGRPPRSWIVTTGQSLDYNGAPVFNDPYQQYDALKLLLHDPTVFGLPIQSGGTLVCGATSLYSDFWGPALAAPYGRTYVLDVNPQLHRFVRVADAASCHAANEVANASAAPPPPLP